jgi:hypothetical protein
MNTQSSAIACDLQALSDTERKREQILLEMFRSLLVDGTWSGNEVTFKLPADAVTLSQLGEFIAYERRCCPFLEWRLAVDATERASLSISDPEGTRAFVEATFVRTTD